MRRSIVVTIQFVEGSRIAPGSAYSFVVRIRLKSVASVVPADVFHRRMRKGQHQ